MLVRLCRRALVGAVVLALGGCGESGTGADGGTVILTAKEHYQDLFWSYCLPFAEVLTALEQEQSGDSPDGAHRPRAALATVPCPDGGSATFDPMTGVATLEDCGGAGAEVSGTLNLSLEQQSANIFGGELTVRGGFEGTATIQDGFMNWELPVQDATTYWELRIELDETVECIWSGADYGDCPDPF